MSKHQFHSERSADIARSRAQSSYNNGETDALLSIYYLLDERLPKAPMQTIATPTAPQDTKLPSLDEGFKMNCTERNRDSLTVTALGDEDFEFLMDSSDSTSIVYVAKSDGERLARAILASI